MNKQLTEEQIRRRRAAGHELRERAAQLLEDASMLDGFPILHFTVADLGRVAEALGLPASELTAAVRTLFPGGDAGECAEGGEED